MNLIVSVIPLLIAATFQAGDLIYVICVDVLLVLVSIGIYLGISFYTGAWERSWIVWPCAGVLFAAVWGIAKGVTAKKD